MCRLAAFPPGTTFPEAMELAKTLEGHNVDGVGTAHVVDGQFVVKKFPIPLSQAIEKRLDLFNHMPHDGWTILHTRLATHGDKTDKNTHPFEIGDYAFAHNGVWGESEICRFALQGHVTFNGETDSEVAGYFFNLLGPDRFAKSIMRGGVFLGLHRSGELHVVKTYGDLQFASTTEEVYVDKPKGCLLIASEIKTKRVSGDDVREVDTGIIKMGKDGTVISITSNVRKPWNRYETQSNYQSNYLPFAGYGGRVVRDVRDSSTVVKTNGKASVEFWSLDPNNYMVNMLGEE